jgi:hypothetical protein
MNMRDTIGVEICENGVPVSLTSSAGVVLEPTINLDTNAFTAGDIIFDFVALTGALSAVGRIGLLQSLVYEDKADTGFTPTFIFADSLVDLGVENAVPTITDADSFKLLGHYKLQATDILDLGGARLATARNIGLMLEGSASTTIYMAAIVETGGTAGTFAAADLQLRVGILQG